MDWITILKKLQSDFIARIPSSSLLHCQIEGQHSELTIISGERLRMLRNFCWQMAEKYKRVSSVRDVFTSFLKGKLGEEVVKERLGNLITEVDYEQRIGGDGNVDFTLAANSAIGIEVKSRCGSMDAVKWSVSSEEVAKNAVVVCVLIQEKVNEAQSEYHLLLAGFLPTAMIKLKTGRISFGIEQLLYGGGLIYYLEQLQSSQNANISRDKIPVYQFISNLEKPGIYEHEEEEPSQSLEDLMRLYIQTGDDSLGRGNYEAAIIAYNGALKVNKNSADVFYKIAVAKYQLGDYEGAISDCMQAVNINPNYIKAYQKSGLARYQIGDYAGAIEDFSQAIRINPHDTFAYTNRAYARAKLGDNQGAIEDYNQAMKLNPHIKYSNGFKANFIQPAEDTPTTAVDYKNRGNLRYDSGNFSGAIADYSEAINLNIQDADAYFNRANAKYDLGDLQGAIEDYNQVIKINPLDAGAYFYRGNTKCDLNDRQGATEDFQKAMELYHKEGKISEFRRVKERILDLEIETSLDTLNF